MTGRAVAAITALAGCWTGDSKRKPFDVSSRPWGSQGTFKIYFILILFKQSPTPPSLMIFCHSHTRTLARCSLCVLSLRDFHGKLSREGLFHSPFSTHRGGGWTHGIFQRWLGSRSRPPTSSAFFGDKSMLLVGLRAGGCRSASLPYSFPSCLCL